MPPFVNTNNNNAPSTSTSLSYSRSNLARRWSCDYYDTGCSTHRTVLLSIIIAVVVLKVIIVSLLCARHHRRKANKRLQIAQGQAAVHARKSAMQEHRTLEQIGLNGQAGDRMGYGVDGYGAGNGGGVEVPPPAYRGAGVGGGDKEVVTGGGQRMT